MFNQVTKLLGTVSVSLQDKAKKSLSMKYGMAKNYLFQGIIAQHVELIELGVAPAPKAISTRVGNSYSQIQQTEKIGFYKIVCPVQLYVSDYLIHAFRSSAANVWLE